MSVAHTTTTILHEGPHGGEVDFSFEDGDGG
jgi:hypothetical protein